MRCARACPRPLHGSRPGHRPAKRFGLDGDGDGLLQGHPPFGWRALDPWREPRESVASVGDRITACVEGGARRPCGRDGSLRTPHVCGRDGSLRTLRPCGRDGSLTTCVRRRRSPLWSATQRWSTAACLRRGWASRPPPSCSLGEGEGAGEGEGEGEDEVEGEGEGESEGEREGSGSVDDHAGRRGSTSTRS